METASIEDVRRTCGIKSTEIEDDDVIRLIDEAVAAVGRYLNTSVVPKDTIETRTATFESEVIMLRHCPVLRIKAVKIDGTAISPKYIKIYPGGKLVLTEDAEETEWDDDDPETNVIRYVYGYLDETLTETTTSNAETAGSSVTIDVAATSGLKAGDWVHIVGMDGNAETTEVSSVVDGVSITCDLSFNHEADSKVVRMGIHKSVKRFVEIITSMMMIARIVGQSYDDIVGYGLGDFNVQKGEPYTQFRESYNQLEKERQLLLKSLRPMPAVG